MWAQPDANIMAVSAVTMAILFITPYPGPEGLCWFLLETVCRDQSRQA
jgi:hypothetical protein